MKNRKKITQSIKLELIKKSKEAALSAIQIFNNPAITFKAETYIVLMNIAWTYLLHAYYKDKNIEYRYYRKNGKQRRFDKTKHGAFKYWDLEYCLNSSDCPIDNHTKNNLKFLINIRHEIEHKMTSKIDDLLSARFQACCLNYNDYLKQFFGNKHGIEKHLSFSLQLSTISEPQKKLLEDQKDLPKNILGCIQDFDESLSEDEYNSQKYAYRVIFIPKLANHKGSADKVIEFIKSDDPIAQTVAKELMVIKDGEKKKYIPSQIVSLMNKNGFPRFSMHRHILLWKEHDAKNPANGYGADIAGKNWYYYQNWVDVVKEHCEKNANIYK
ncbi:MAG: DUF3644 domain-containing protein [Candidatus Paracaedibacteraceae bacterium]|nr:DUF3644 domain-containing protein [Candidatus Paracaedibacteraceae bacterium]